MDFLALGAADYITTPVRDVDLLPRIWRFAAKPTEEDSTAKNLKEKIGLGEMVGRSPAFLAEVRKIPVVARCDAAVLITGETGTGKEAFARALHYLSPRSGHPFVAVSCGAIPSDLVENELFGHVRGAFTGAHASQPGLVLEANGGTLFLDDVDALPLAAQVKFLRVLQEKEYKELGSTKTRRADIRVVSTTNTDLEEAVKTGRFRSDLFYRLSVIPLALPPLRDRKEDIPLLAQHFIEKHSFEFGKEGVSLSADALSVLINHDWSGNVRELENVVERAVVFCTGSAIEPSHVILPAAVGGTGAHGPDTFKEAKAKMIAQFERGYVEDLLRKHRGNISAAARAAQKNRRAFWELVRKHGINTSDLENNPFATSDKPAQG